MEELDLKELFKIFWDKKTEIILIVVIFTLIGVIYTSVFVTPKYTANTKLLLATDSSSEDKVGEETITTTDVTINSKLVSTYSELVQSNKIVRKVISNLGMEASKENAVRKSISVTAVKDTEVIQIAVTNEDAVLASKIANEVAKVFIDAVKEFYGIDNVHVVDEAEIPEGPSNINHVKDVAIFVVIGAVVAIMYTLILNIVDTTIKSVEDIEKISKLPVLAAIPIYDMAEERSKGKRKGGKR